MGAVRVQITPRTAVGVRPEEQQSALGRSISEGMAQLQVHLANALVVTSEALGVTSGLGRELPNILVALLTPAAMIALVMGLWRVSADLNWSGAFPVTVGFFSHWQVWIGLSVALKVLSSSLLAWDRRTRKISEEQ